MAQSQKRLAELRDGKLQLPYLKNADWVLGFAEARAKAAKTGKPIFAYFTRSDERCMNSISMECGALAEDGFREFANSVVPFCNITTKVKTDADQELFEAKGGVKYPHVVLMNAAGNVRYVVRGEKLSDFQNGLQELGELEALRKRVDAGDRHAKYPFLKKQLELQHLDFPAAKKAMKKLPRLSKAQNRELAPLLLRAEVHHIVSRAGKSQKARAKAGEKFFRMHKAGRVPIQDGLLPFWLHILDYAEMAKKAVIYEEALDTLKQEFPELPWMEQERTLRELQSNG